MPSSSSSTAPATWSEVVHEQRKAAAIARARAEYRQRRRGRPVEVAAVAKMPALLCAAGAVAALAAWRREGRRPGGGQLRDVKSLPLVRHVLALLGGDAPRPSSSRGAPARGAVKPRQVAAPTAAAAAATSSSGRSGGGGGGSGGAARAAASSWDEAAAQQLARGGQQQQQKKGTSGGGGGKKGGKGGGKKKR